VNKDVDCQVFEDQLDALVKGTLPEEGMRQLRRHADTCSGCAMQLRVQEHLAHPSLQELEARVPEELLGSLWPRVLGEVRAGAGTRLEAAPGVKTPGFRPRFRWLVPTLAAATLVLLFSTGFLALELGQLKDQAAILTQQAAEQQRWLAGLEVGPSADPVARTAALAGRNPWLRALGRQESISVDGLRVFLERMPGNRVLMSETQLGAALRAPSPLGMPLLKDLLEQVETRDGIRARDLLEALEGMDLNPGLTVSTSDLIDLLS
jgi:hypothetical protein